jgi:hypothetical protein
VENKVWRQLQGTRGQETDYNNALSAESEVEKRCAKGKGDDDGEEAGAIDDPRIPCGHGEGSSFFAAAAIISTGCLHDGWFSVW